MWLRNGWFDRGLGVRQAPVPVVSIGNLTTGGTGKTPLVEFLARALCESHRVVILSRGYRGGKTANDESRLLARRLPEVPVLQDPDRVRGAKRAVEEFGAEVIVLDDGFQHRRLGRAVDIVLIDALCPFGFGRILPAGLLREPCRSLARADLVVLTRADAVSEGERRHLIDQVTRLAPRAGWMEAAFAPVGLVGADGSTARLADLAGRKVVAFCGIGNPRGFWATLASLGARILESREFPDHHEYSMVDKATLARLAQDRGAEWLVATEKDLVKFQETKLGGILLWGLAIEARVLRGGNQIEAVRARLTQPRSTVPFLRVAQPPDEMV